MTPIDLSLRAAHVASGDDSDHIFSGAKDEKEQAPCISAAKDIKSSLRVRVCLIRCDNQGLIEKNLLALKRADLMLSPNLLGVLLIPLEPEIFGESGFAHAISILWTYTNNQGLSGPNEAVEKSPAVDHRIKINPCSNITANLQPEGYYSTASTDG